jgi:hypothetical protein
MPSKKGRTVVQSKAPSVYAQKDEWNAYNSSKQAEYGASRTALKDRGAPEYDASKRETIKSIDMALKHSDELKKRTNKK